MAINYKLRIKNALKRLREVKKEEEETPEQTAIILKNEEIIFENAEALTLAEFYSLCNDSETEEWAAAGIQDYCKEYKSDEPTKPQKKQSKGRPVEKLAKENCKPALAILKNKSADNLKSWLENQTEDWNAHNTIHQISEKDRTLVRDLNIWCDKYLSKQGRAKLKSAIRQARFRETSTKERVEINQDTARQLKKLAKKNNQSIDQLLNELMKNT